MHHSFTTHKKPENRAFCVYVKYNNKKPENKLRSRFAPVRYVCRNKSEKPQWQFRATYFLFLLISNNFKTQNFTNYFYTMCVISFKMYQPLVFLSFVTCAEEYAERRPCQHGTDNG